MKGFIKWRAFVAELEEQRGAVGVEVRDIFPACHRVNAFG